MEPIQYEDGFALKSPESNKGKIINAKISGGGHGSRARQAGLQCRYFPRSCMTVTCTTC